MFVLHLLCRHAGALGSPGMLFAHIADGHLCMCMGVDGPTRLIQTAVVIFCGCEVARVRSAGVVSGCVGVQMGWLLHLGHAACHGACLHICLERVHAARFRKLRHVAL
jgi:hypothetical protein